MVRCKTILILRFGQHNSERSIYLYEDENKEPIKFDPQNEYYCATGKWLGRDGCVMSFIEGLMQTGINVRIADRRYRSSRSKQNKTETLIIAKQAQRSIVPEYMMVGVLFGHGLWEGFKADTRARPTAIQRF